MDMDWEYISFHLNASDLQASNEGLALPELARRLSEAIIELTNQQKADRWEMVKMDFDAGNVTLNFRRERLKG